MKQYVKNQDGAALLLVLFVILFLSIVGTPLLNTTTYSMKTIERNTVEQEEFYRAEGALEIYINEMNNYYHSYINPTTGMKVEEKGPYFYLLRKSLNSKYYDIAGKSLKVEGSIDGVLYDPRHTNFNPEEVSPVIVTLEAAYDDPDESTIKRIAKIKINANSTKITETIPGTPVTPDVPEFSAEPILGFTNHINPHHEDIVGKLSVPFADVIKFYEIDTKNAKGILDEDYSFNGSRKHYFKEIEINKGDELIIPAGHIVYVESANFAGKGKPGVTKFIVNGILIANDLDITGNMTYEINGAIIANTLKMTSNAITIGVNSGINPDGSGGGYNPLPNEEAEIEDYNWSSNISGIISLETKR